MTKIEKLNKSVLLGYLPLVEYLHFYITAKNSEKEDEDLDGRIGDVCDMQISEKPGRGTSITHDGKELLITINGTSVTAKFNKR